MVATRVDYSLYIYATLLNFAPGGVYVSQTFLVNHKVFWTARVDLNDYYIIRHVHNYAFTMVHVWTEKKPEYDNIYKILIKVVIV